MVGGGVAPLEVTTVVLLKIQVLWEMTLCRVFSPSVEMKKAVDCFETSACADPMTLPYGAVWLFPVEPKNFPSVPNAAQLSSE